jgi:hypothetical protein
MTHHSVMQLSYNLIIPPRYYMIHACIHAATSDNFSALHHIYYIYAYITVRAYMLTCIFAHLQLHLAHKHTDSFYHMFIYHRMNIDFLIIKYNNALSIKETHSI